MIAFIYLLVAAGFREAGFGLFRSLVWPKIIGRMIARRALQEGGT